METNKFLAKQDIEQKIFYIWEDFFEGNFVRAFVRNIDSFDLREVSEDLRVEVEYNDFDPKTLLIRGYNKNILKQEVEIGDQESFDEFSDKLNLVIEALGLNETEEVYYTGAIYDIEQIVEDFEEDKEDVILNGLIDLRDSGLMVLYSPKDRDIIATGTKEQFKEFVKTNEYMSEYDWHAYGGGGAMVDELIATEYLWVEDEIETVMKYKTNLDNEIKKLVSDLPEEKLNKLNENRDNQEYEYTLLSRLVSDCKYFLGYGNCDEAHSLWGITIENHIETMHDLYDSLIVKPEWLTKEDINDYENKLYNCKPKYNNFDRAIKEQEEKTKELDWLLNLPEGFVVAISACRGKDCSRTGELEERLRRYNYIRVVGKWGGVEETSFLVYVRTRDEAKKLINLGTKTFDQDDVYVWETPMNIKDITKNTGDEGTKLDGDYYFFDLDKIILKRSDLEKLNKKE